MTSIQEDVLKHIGSIIKLNKFIPRVHYAYSNIGEVYVQKDFKTMLTISFDFQSYYASFRIRNKDQLMREFIMVKYDRDLEGFFNEFKYQIKMVRNDSRKYENIAM